MTEEQMHLCNYLYENKMFTNKRDAALLGKENAWEVRGEVGKE